MSKMRGILLALFLMLAFAVFSQDKMKIDQADYENQSVEMADVMRSNGKIYVVVAVIVSIFAGLILYTVRVETKIKKLENRE